MESRIEKIVSDCIINLSVNDNQSLLTGNAGCMLLLTMYNSWKPNNAHNNYEYYLQRLLDGSYSYHSVSFANGKAGINWFFQYLTINQTLLDKDDCMEICFDFPLLQKMSLIELEKGNWDMLHGAMGIAYSKIYNYEKSDDDYYRNFFRGLKKIAFSNKSTSMFPNYNFERNSFVADEVNFGLAHGIPSILKFCIECYKRNICKEDAFELAQQIIDFLVGNIHRNKEHSFFPSIYQLGNSVETRSRLAWCYGDLGVAFMLYQAGNTFNLQEIIHLALEALKHTTIRRSAEQTMVYDAGFCHGSAGAAHIYNKMWHYTNDWLFKEATDYWIQRTLDFAIHEDGIAGYKMYNPKDNTFSNSYGVLEGTAGIGLVLLSYLTGDFSWDYCLMLND